MRVKILLPLLFAFIFSGCADKFSNTTPQLYTTTTQPIFITNVKLNEQNTTKKSAYVFFKNSSGYQNSLEAVVLNRLLNFGFTQSLDMTNADLVVLGDFLSLQRFEVKQKRPPRVFMDMGYGWGSRGFRGRSMGLGMMFPFGDDWDFERTDHYIYKALVSVMVRTNSQEQRTNIEIQSGENLYSPSYILPFIEQKIADQIINFFY